MDVDYIRLMQRLAAMPAEQKALRNRLVEEGYSIREATRRAVRSSRPRPAVSQAALSEAVATAVARHEDARRARKAAKKAAARTAQEAADRALVDRLVRERLQAARQFSEASAGVTLREASRDDLAFVAVTAMGSRQPGPGRPVLEADVDPAALSLGDLPVAALLGSAGNSPFWAGGNASYGPSPFWRGLERPGEG